MVWPRTAAPGEMNRVVHRWQPGLAAHSHHHHVYQLEVKIAWGGSHRSYEIVVHPLVRGICFDHKIVTNTQEVLCPSIPLLGLYHFSNNCKARWLLSQAQLDRWKKVWALEVHFNATQPPGTGAQVILVVPKVSICWNTTAGQFKCC